MKTNGREAFVEPAADVEDKCAIGDLLPEVAKVLRLAFVEPAVISDGEVALAEGAEVRISVEGACRPIPKELGFDG